MDIPVLIQAVPGRGFVATAPAFGWSAEGPTRDAALGAIRQRVADGTAGSDMAWLAIPNGVPAGPPSLMDWAGTWKDDPLLEDFQRAVEEHRATANNDPGTP
jgi:hypothetical protein